MKALLVLLMPALAAPRPVPLKIRTPTASTAASPLAPKAAAPTLPPAVAPSVQPTLAPTLQPSAQPAAEAAPLPGRMGSVFTAIKLAISAAPVEDKLDELEPGTLLSNGAVLVHSGEDEVKVVKNGKPATLSRKNAAKLKPAGQSRPEGIDWKAAERKQQERRAYKAFVERNHWRDVAAAFGPELRKLRALPKDQRPAYVRAQGDELVERLKAKFGAANIGFHYNLHGGQRHQYVEGGGIRATMGDIALQYSMNGDRNYKVYFFQTKHHALYDVLNERHPQFASRMGHVLMLFDVDKVPNGVRPTQISLDFDQGFGVPYAAFLMPPLDVFNGVAKKAGQRRLSRDEETLAVMRYIEAAAGVAPPRELDLSAGKELGRGARGVVLEHPASPDHVVKIVHLDPGQYLFGLPDPEKIAADEEAVARRLGEAGVGPAYVERRGLASVRQRIRGVTLRDLIEGRNYSPAEHAKVLALLERMAKSGIKVDDMKPANIMVDAERAWLIDSDKLLEAPASAQELLDQQVPRTIINDPLVGEVAFTDRFGDLLERGLDRYHNRGLWARLRQLLKDLASTPVTPGIR